jgi:hypothetical protein
MLLGNQGQPLAPCEFLMDGKSETRNNVTHLLVFFLKNSGEDRNAARLENTIDFGEKAYDEFCGEIARDHVN